MFKLTVVVLSHLHKFGYIAIITQSSFADNHIQLWGIYFDLWMLQQLMMKFTSITCKTVSGAWEDCTYMWIKITGHASFYQKVFIVSHLILVIRNVFSIRIKHDFRDARRSSSTEGQLLWPYIINRKSSVIKLIVDIERVYKV